MTVSRRCRRWARAPGPGRAGIDGIPARNYSLRYAASVRHEVSAAFAAGQHPDYVALRDLPADPTESALLGARAAAVCVPESFIEHALRLGGCTSGLRRASSKSTAPDELALLPGPPGKSPI